MAKIILDHGEKVKLAKAHGVSTVTVRSALAFKTRSLLADKIRNTAIKNFGGKLKD